MAHAEPLSFVFIITGVICHKTENLNVLFDVGLRCVDDSQLSCFCLSSIVSLGFLHNTMQENGMYSLLNFTSSWDL